MSGVSILPVVGLPEIEAGADLAAMIAALEPLADGDVVVITSKIVSKAEGCATELDEVMALGDRVAVMHGGQLSGPYDAPVDRDAIGLLMAGIEPDRAITISETDADATSP